MWDAAHPSKHQMASSIPGNPRLPLPDLILAKACQVKRWARSMQRKRVADRGVRLGDPRKPIATTCVYGTSAIPSALPILHGRSLEARFNNLRSCFRISPHVAVAKVFRSAAVSLARDGNMHDCAISLMESTLTFSRRKLFLFSSKHRVMVSNAKPGKVTPP